MPAGWRGFSSLDDTVPRVDKTQISAIASRRCSAALRVSALSFDSSVFPSLPLLRLLRCWTASQPPKTLLKNETRCTMPPDPDSKAQVPVHTWGTDWMGAIGKCVIPRYGQLRFFCKIRS